MEVSSLNDWWDKTKQKVPQCKTQCLQVSAYVSVMTYWEAVSETPEDVRLNWSLSDLTVYSGPISGHSTVNSVYLCRLACAQESMKNGCIRVPFSS